MPGNTAGTVGVGCSWSRRKPWICAHSSMPAQLPAFTSMTLHPSAVSMTSRRTSVGSCGRREAGTRADTESAAVRWSPSPYARKSVARHGARSVASCRNSAATREAGWNVTHHRGRMHGAPGIGVRAVVQQRLAVFAKRVGVSPLDQHVTGTVALAGQNLAGSAASPAQAMADVDSSGRAPRVDRLVSASWERRAGSRAEVTWSDRPQWTGRRSGVEAARGSMDSLDCLDTERVHPGRSQAPGWLEVPAR